MHSTLVTRLFGALLAHYELVQSGHDLPRRGDLGGVPQAVATLRPGRGAAAKGRHSIQWLLTNVTLHIKCECV